MSIKIAFPTDDGEKISRHFGAARYFQVITVAENGQTSAELRDKGGHGGHGQRHEQGHEHGHSHEHGHEHGHGHGPKFALLADCQVFIGAGMGQPAYDRLQNLGLTVYLTREKSIADALAKYQADAIDNDMRRVHAHHHHDHDHDDSGRQDVTFFDQ
jgi:predicted Fe-Mo cluster-binding NifX family protein